MSDDAIRIECPGCYRRFRMRARGANAPSRVKCPKCGTRIDVPPPSLPEPEEPPTDPSRKALPPLPPLPSKSAPKPGPARPRVPQAPRQQPAQQQPSRQQPARRTQTTDDELRQLLKKAKRRRRSEPNVSVAPAIATPPDADETQPDLPTNVGADTDPGVQTDPELGMMTMPMGRHALTAQDLGTSGRDTRTQAPEPARKPNNDLPRRPRRETPRAGLSATSAGLVPRPVAPAGVEAPYVDEPTYRGPMPGKKPDITPSGSDLSRFLEPGRYLVRVDESVYDSVSEKELVTLLNAGVFFAIDELRRDDEEWVAISAPDLFAGLRDRLAHRAHHMLARVVKPRPASDYGRPPPPSEAPPSIIVDSNIHAMPSEEDLAKLEADAAAQDESQPPPTVPEQAADKRKSNTRKVLLVAGVLGFMGLSAVGTAAMFAFGDGTIIAGPADGEDAGQTAELEIDAGQLGVLSREDVDTLDVIPAFQSAFASVESAHAVADSIEGKLLTARSTKDGRLAAKLEYELWKRDPSSNDPQKLSANLMAHKLWQPARQVANWGIATGDASPQLPEVVRTSLESQFAEDKLVEITADRFDRIVDVVIGKRPSFVIADKSGAHYKIWPDLGNRAWRNDIAAYRLCEMLVCHFRIPETNAAVIDKAAYEEIVSRSEGSAHEMGTTLQPEFDWQGGKLRASIRRMSNGVPWPIELSQVWRPWLTAGAGVGALEDDVEVAHQSIAFYGAHRVYPEVRGMQARSLARQVSSILLFDFLTNNWNRFSPVEENWGSRTWIDAGLIYSVDDSAAFYVGDSRRVNGRFTWTKRFSRATIESLKALDEKQAGALLFPNAEDGDKEKLESLWKQRSKALRRIKSLVKKYGVDDVYALDGDDKK